MEKVQMINKTAHDHMGIAGIDHKHADAIASVILDWTLSASGTGRRLVPHLSLIDALCQKTQTYLRRWLVLACVWLAVAGCTSTQIASNVTQAAIMGNPMAAKKCLTEEDGACWIYAHWHDAQFFCKAALEGIVPKPHRWEETPSTEPLVAFLDPKGIVIPSAGAPAFYDGRWLDRAQGQVILRGAYDLQSRSGLTNWTPWAYSCIYDTFRYEVLNVSVEPPPPVHS